MALGLVSAGLFGDGVLGMVDMPQWKPTPHPKSLVPLCERTQTLVGRVRSYTLGGHLSRRPLWSLLLYSM